MMVARLMAMATATKMAMAPNRDNTGTGNGKATAATMMGRVTGHKGHGHSHNAWREGDDGGDGPWFVCEFLGEWRDDEK